MGLFGRAKNHYESEIFPRNGCFIIPGAPRFIRSPGETRKENKDLWECAFVLRFGSLDASIPVTPQ